ncbi:MAG TPA: hypothetical protein VKT78_18595 [Fimbriimonadaceae bacterium]|nr:hypothetical protein [Fimbriimonadaceae bacterium]
MVDSSDNALRTLGIILTSIFLYVGSAVLLLASACFGLIASGTHGRDGSQLTILALALLGGAVALIVIGTTIIAKLSRGMVRTSPPYPLVPIPAVPTPGAPPTTAAHPEPALPARPASIDPSHFSPASHAAINNLALAIGALIALDLLFALAPVHAVFGDVLLPQVRYSIPYALIYRLLAVAPYIILWIAVRRSPSPRTFAYALAIPAVPVAWGIFSVPIVLIALLHTPTFLPRLLWIVLPFIADIVILYYAWTAIQRTGIHPPPKRLILASVVVLTYRFAFTAIAGVLFAMTTHLFRG